MGRAKEWMMEQCERGYSAVEGDICAACVSDGALKAWVDANVSATRCTFCGAEADEPIAASLDEFVGFVLAGIRFEWNHPDNEGIMYISAEGGYQAPVSDLWDVLSDYDISEDENVTDALLDAIDDNGWVERDFYHGNDGQRLKWGWDAFKHLTKSERRYFFLHRDDDDDRDELTASDMLQTIAGMIKSKLGDYDLIRELVPDTKIFRIRIADDAFDKAGQIGTPPAEFARQSNRMSPAGIPMFYGAFDVETAFAETFEPEHNAGQVASSGTFQPVRNLRVLDLAELPKISSVFDPDRRGLIHTLRFLHAFARDISKRIERDGREHIEYVPTQIVTEYFRRVFRTEDSKALDGIVYRSARCPGACAVVLFCEHRQCIDVDSTADDESLMRLTGVVSWNCPSGEAAANCE